MKEMIKSKISGCTVKSIIARISCMSLKPTASLFRLKRNHQNLTTEEYSENLISYLNNAPCCKTLTVEDLNNVMRGIMGRSINVNKNNMGCKQNQMESNCTLEIKILKL